LFVVMITNNFVQYIDGSIGTYDSPLGKMSAKVLEAFMLSYI
jgi:hypothetical protein